MRTAGRADQLRAAMATRGESTLILRIVRAGQAGKFPLEPGFSAATG
jgi:hypothetical protein